MADLVIVLHRKRKGAAATSERSGAEEAGGSHKTWVSVIEF